MASQRDEKPQVVVVDRHAYQWSVLRQAPAAVRVVAVVGYLLALAGIGLFGFGVVTSMTGDLEPGEEPAIMGTEVLGVPLLVAAFGMFFVGFVLVAVAGLLALRRRDGG